MKKKVTTLILTGAFLAAVTSSALAGPAASKARTRLQTPQFGTQSGTPIRDHKRLQDGSCTTSTQMDSGAKKGNTYGPGDGTGYDGFGPEDGTGFGGWPW